MVHTQYVGITGFTSQGQVNELLKNLPNGFGKTDSQIIRKIMVGMLVSGKTIKGIPNKWPHRYPTPDVIPSIFVDDPRVLNLVHYNTKESSPNGIFDELCLIQETAGKNFHGFQLNMVWPDPDLLSDWVQYAQSKSIGNTIVLQCGGTALSQVNNSPVELAEKLREYEGIIEYALLDPSGGYGRPFDPGSMIAYLKAIDEAHLPMIDIGVAGGLNPDNLDDILAPVLKEFPNVSIDAEGKLRTKDDHLDMQIAKRYLLDTDTLMQKYSRK